MATRHARASSRLFGLVLLACAAATPAQEWPKQRPITFVVVNAPGAITDILARLVAQKAGAALGQVVLVDNRPGAGGNIAAQRVRGAAADGYTILLTSAAYAVNPSLYANAGYDPVRDFVPVVLAGSVPNVVCVHPSVPAESLRELIELARTRALAYASPGIGTTPHLSMERIKSAAKINLTHVPYQPASAVTATVAGQTEALSLSLSLTLPQLKAGKLRALAVTSARRAAVLPDVPTVNEQGFDDLNWFGFFAPVGVRADIVARLHGEIARALDAPDVRQKLSELGLDSRPNTPGEFAAFVRTEVSKWARAVKDSGAKAD